MPALMRADKNTPYGLTTVWLRLIMPSFEINDFILCKGAIDEAHLSAKRTCA